MILGAQGNTATRATVKFNLIINRLMSHIFLPELFESNEYYDTNDISEAMRTFLQHRSPVMLHLPFSTNPNGFTLLQRFTDVTFSSPAVLSKLVSNDISDIIGNFKKLSIITTGQTPIEIIDSILQMPGLVDPRTVQKKK